MSDLAYPDPAEQADLTAQDELLARLLGTYAQRREHHRPTRRAELLAHAEEHGPEAARTLRTVIALYEALRATHAH